MRKLAACVSLIALTSACGGADGPEAEEVPQATSEENFDEQLSEEEANALLDELDAEESADSTE